MAIETRNGTGAAQQPRIVDVFRSGIIGTPDVIIRSPRDLAQNRITVYEGYFNNKWPGNSEAALAEYKQAQQAMRARQAAMRR